MLYIGHFSFAFESKARRQKPQAWHGQLTAVAEAANATAALQKLEDLIRKTAATSDLFTDVSEVFLESCVELRAVPRAGLLAHLALLEGDSEGSISTTLPGVDRKHARSYHFEPETVDADGAFEAEPFAVLKAVRPTRAKSKTKGKAAKKPAAARASKARKA